MLSDYYTLSNDHDPATFDLFTQWLYTRKYQEKDELATFHAGFENIALAGQDYIPEDAMDWAIKAAVLCWELGASLGAKNFQNYAMERLFEAFSRPLSRPLTVFLFLHTYLVGNEENFHCISPLQRLIQDVIVRNWGDDTIVQHGDQEIWSDTLEAFHDFRRVFIEATSQTLERRRERELSLEDYLIHQEFDMRIS